MYSTPRRKWSLLWTRYRLEEETQAHSGMIGEVSITCLYLHSENFRAHELWNSVESPDIVTFSKKFQVAGYFFKPYLKPKEV